MTNKWVLHRAGLINFWYYDEQYFEFADGKLLLRGTNGSGKSVTMQSLLPVLLDGKKTPDRLDPFGSRARRMEDYLLGEKEIVDRDERTGYLFLEYKRKQTEQYVTTGIGLRAKRQKNMDFWGFVIFDNRRIGRDVFLYKTEKSANGTEKIPLTKRELANLLGNGGTVVDSQKEYMELVNKHVFRFESMEAFQELIELLIQLRSPKLSKDFKPTVIYEILESSLPALTDDELRHLSETIENMDQTKQQLEQLERDEQSLKRLCGQYRAYNEYMIAEKASEWLKAEKQVKRLVEEGKQWLTEEAETEAHLVDLSEYIQTLANEQDVLHQRELELASHEVFQAAQQYERIQREIQNVKEKQQKLLRQIDEKEQIERRYKRQLEETNDKLYETEKQLDGQLEDLRHDALESSFSAHDLNEADFSRHRQTPFDFTVWKREGQGYVEKLEQILTLWRRHDEIKARYEETSKEVGDLQREVDELRHEEAKWLELLENEKSRFQQEVFRWLEQCQDVSVQETSVQLFLQRLHELYETYHIDEMKQPFTEAYYEALNRKNEEKMAQKHACTLLEEKIAAKEAEWNQWKMQKDPELARDEQTLAARAELDKKGVAFVPFYAGVEFQDHVPEPLRERIESALYHAGLLDALITETDVEVSCDRVLFPRPVEMAHTLADYLQPDVDEACQVSKTRIEEVLQSIVLSDREMDGAFVLNEAGHYTLGLVKGHAPMREKALFIGRTARKRWRLEKIAALEAELAELRAHLYEQTEMFRQLDEAIEQMKNWFRSFPTDRDMRAAFEEREKTKRTMFSKQQEWEKKNEKLAQLARNWQQLKQTLREQTEGLDIEFSKDGYEQSLLLMKSYMRRLHELQLTHQSFVHLFEMIERLTEQVGTLQQEIDDIKGERNVLANEQQKLDLKRQEIERTMQLMGAEEVQAEIQRVRARLAFLQKEMPAKTNERIALEHQLKAIREKREQLEGKEAFAKRLAGAWRRSFEREVALELVELHAQDAVEQAKEAIERYGAQLKETRTSLVNRLNSVFFQESANLTEYRLSQEPVVVEEASPFAEIELDEEMELKVAGWREKQDRIVLLLDYKGQRVSPFYVWNEIEHDIFLQREYMKEQDRELYEEIILKTIGRILRSRIQRAERWVKDMNDLMQQLDTSSGLVLFIQWKPRTAETEEEMDTKELVELLRMNSRLLKEEDLQRVTKHFRSKINRARELLEERGQGNTLHQIIKEVLDYRKWFSFTLYYQKTNEPKRELTNQRFYQFSGGEKAMAMYIPLFAATYSRYQEAAEDAPYIISLDEAFAGVDENNIRNMFGLVEQLGFNYVMNSQALWGDYDTVPSLSICELVRPKNASFVTVIRYYWNGKVKQLVTEARKGELIEPIR
ncbi:ATPase involved in DNA repair [Anoxybacillus ayderensis]|uniref:ATPase involved in DNA repair n=1 Tax=Anoxybacillus ayderensis TaxID=265546 RepID=A0A0D0HKI4_9BACL|nr:TIGR02680 family protein [Anoxybacillus ayderensis]EPZ38854.1 ATPase [Anoxybacillus ayderensis]KIP20729.1 ATPase involved in DNA repair [Anoxybacillus ayderensis]